MSPAAAVAATLTGRENLEYVALVATTVVMLPVGRWTFARAERCMRIHGTLGQY